MSKAAKEYEPKFRYGFSPKTAVVQPAPQKRFNRLANLSGQTSKSGLSNMHKGNISLQSARKIRNAIEWLLAAASEKYVYSANTKKYHKWKLSFLTLTLPTQGQMSDIEVKSILNSFLTLAKYNYGLHSYIWKAEPQRRGVIHFHLTSDCYMWKRSVQFEWNRLLAKHGLLNGHTNAPSTKIHSTYRVKNMAAYLTKYFIKPPAKHTKAPFKPRYKGVAVSHRGDEDSVSFNLGSLFYCRPISGRLWGCSQSLSSARSLSYIVDQAEMRAMNEELRETCKKEIQKPYCNEYRLPDDYYDKLAYGQLKHEYLSHLYKIRKRKNLHQFEIYDGEGKQVTDKKIIARIRNSAGKAAIAHV